MLSRRNHGAHSQIYVPDEDVLRRKSCTSILRFHTHAGRVISFEYAISEARGSRIHCFDFGVEFGKRGLIASYNP